MNSSEVQCRCSALQSDMQIMQQFFGKIWPFLEINIFRLTIWWCQKWYFYKSVHSARQYKVDHLWDIRFWSLGKSVWSRPDWTWQRWEGRLGTWSKLVSGLGTPGGIFVVFCYQHNLASVLNHKSEILLVSISTPALYSPGGLAEGRQTVGPVALGGCGH